MRASTAAPRHIWRAGGRWLLDRLLPACCLVCDQPVERQGQLCGDCFRRMAFIAAPFCRRCSVPFVSAAQGGHAMVCSACEDAPPQWARARAALRYDDLSKQLVLQLKHADRPEIAGMLAAHMARAGAELLTGDPVLVPVPLARGRLFDRRYNQSALLAAHLGRLCGCAWVPDALRRIRPTPSLGGLKAGERAEAVAGAFAPHPRRLSLIQGRRVILIDDVLTSGATANECARVLLAAGAAMVDVLVSSRVPDPRA